MPSPERSTAFGILSPIPFEEGNIYPVPLKIVEYFGLFLSNSLDISPSKVHITRSIVPIGTISGELEIL